MRRERYQQRLLSRGVSAENVMLLLRDVNEPLPTPIRKDLAVYKQRQVRADREERTKRARQAFESQWLKNTEKELHECMVTLEASLDPEMKASMNALREMLEEKLKDHHMHLGTLGCQEALARRKKVCMELGLLRKEDQDMVKSQSEPLPLPNSKQSVETDEELFEGKPKTPTYLTQDDVDQFGTQSPCSITYGQAPDDESSDEESLFVTPVPSNAASTSEDALFSEDSYAVSNELPFSKKRRRGSRQLSQEPTKRPRNTLVHYFSASQR